jgi:hypothetical protein
MVWGTGEGKGKVGKQINIPMAPLPATMVLNHNPRSQAQFALHDLGAGILADLVFTACAVVFGDFCL